MIYLSLCDGCYDKDIRGKEKIFDILHSWVMMFSLSGVSVRKYQ